MTAEPVAWDDPKIAYVVTRCRGRRVIDLGCVMHDPRAYTSRYWLHRALAESAAEVIGIDLDSEGVAALAARGYRMLQGDAEDFSVTKRVDVVVAGDIIEHLGNPGGLLRSAREALVPGGCLIIQTPNPWYWRNSVKAMWGREVANNPEHTCWFDPRTMRQLAARFGFELGEVAFHSRYRRDRWLPLPRGWKHTSWSGVLTPRA